MVSRTFFTADINAAFDDMEEGNEDPLKVRRPSTPWPAPVSAAVMVLVCSREGWYMVM